MSAKRFIEIACFSKEAAIIAAEAGAHRIEICKDKMQDGLSVSLNELEDLLRSVNIPVHVMVRPRGGNFVYSAEEFSWMQEYMLKASKLPVAGFVFGCLNQNNSVNILQNKSLVLLANSKPCTFHKAFDEVEDVSKALENIIFCGFKYILSSGKSATALAGIEILKSMQKQAFGRISIMPGGGIRSSHLKEIIQQTNATWVHSSAIIDGGDLPDITEIKKLILCLD